MPLKLYLIRHGETEWSKSGRHTGKADIPVTPEGERQARALGERLRATAFARTLSSPSRRARRTAELVRPSAPAEIEGDLGEWDYGLYEGKTTAQIRALAPDWNLFRDGCPGGESPAEVGARADRLLARLRRLDGNVALFSHGHFGRVLAARWIGLPALEARRFLLDPAALGVLGFEHDDPAAPAVALWNESPGT